MQSLRTYVGALTVTSLALSVLVFVQDRSYDSAQITAAGCFAGLGFLASLLSYGLTKERQGTMAFLPFLTSIVLVPSWLSIVGITTALLLTEIASRREPIKATFNTMQGTFSCATAILLYRWTSGSPLLHPQAFSLVPYVTSIVWFFAANSLAISGIIAIQHHKSIWSMWTSNLRVTLPYDAFSIPFVYVFAYVYVNFGIPGAAIFMIPVIAARQLYKTTRQLEKTNQELLELMVAAIEARDPYTSGHSRRVADKARVISKALGLREKEIERITVAALLHDVGKIHEVFGPILSKPGKLTPEENAIMRTHPLKSEDLAKNVSSLKDILPMIRHHHENWDGSGYPDGLFGSSIPLGSRIIMFADTMDAMTTDRPYRAALDEKAVRKELERYRGKQFDPRMYDALVSSPLFNSLFAEPKAIKSTPVTPSRPVLALSRHA
jgi:HD-GYP domain-containing protein (c-di-GMP phosphodiesterase class II)